MGLFSGKTNPKSIKRLHSAIEIHATEYSKFQEISDLGREIDNNSGEISTTIAEMEGDLSKHEEASSTLAESVKKFEDEIMSLQKKVDKAKLQIGEKQMAISELEDGLSRESERMESVIKELEEASEKFSESRENILKSRAKLDIALRGLRDSSFDGPEENKVTVSKNWKGGSGGIIALGDIHGWAPGLLNFIRHHEFAEARFCGKEWSSGELDGHFRWQGNKYSFVSPPGLDANPYRSDGPPTIFGDIAISESSKTSEKRLILVGDLIDRGDHSELVVELVRQMVASFPGSCFSLLGNHEGMLVKGDFDAWVSNEAPYMEYQEGRPQVVCHSKEATGLDEKVALRANFEALRESVGALLLTQHFSLLESLGKEERGILEEQVRETWKRIGLSPEGLEKIVNKGGWKLYEQGGDFLRRICQEAGGEAIVVPGAIVMWHQDGTMFIHAEPSGFVDIEDWISNPLSGIGTACSREWTVNGSNVRFQLAAVRMTDGDVVICQGDSGFPGLLWARSTKREGDVVKGLGLAKSALADLEAIVHGHTAHNGVKEESHLTDSGEVSVFCIDEAIGPNPRYAVKVEGDHYDTKTVPRGWER